jgi:hypothetical protein
MTYIPPILKIDINAILCLVCNFMREIMTAGSTKSKISESALIIPVVEIPNLENPIFGRFPAT